MVVIPNGVLGPSVPQHVEKGVAVALVLVPILPRVLAEKIALSWDLQKKLVNVTMEAVQVYPIFLRKQN